MNVYRNARMIIIVCIATVIMIWIGMTRNGRDEDGRDESLPAQTRPNDTTRKSFADLGGIEAVKKLEADGLLQKESLMTHEFWVKDDLWKALGDEDKEHVLYLLSSYARDHDGVGQVNIWYSGSDTLAAEIFGGYENIH